MSICQMAKKTHISAGAARDAILDAAEKIVVKVGPAGLRISAVAKQARMAHPNIIHHFGSREGLLNALGSRVGDRITERVTKAIQAAVNAPDSEKVVAIKRILDSVYTGNEGKIAVWMHLNGSMVAIDDNIQEIVTAAHQLRQSIQSNASYVNTTRMVTLITHALIGEVVCGSTIQSALNISEPNDQTEKNKFPTSLSEQFRHWLAELMLSLSDESLAPTSEIER